MGSFKYFLTFYQIIRWTRLRQEKKVAPWTRLKRAAFWTPEPDEDIDDFKILMRLKKEDDLNSWTRLKKDHPSWTRLKKDHPSWTRLKKDLPSWTRLKRDPYLASINPMRFYWTKLRKRGEGGGGSWTRLRRNSSSDSNTTSEYPKRNYLWDGSSSSNNWIRMT